MLVQVAVAVGIDGDVVVVARLDETDGLSRRIVSYRGDGFEAGKAAHGADRKSVGRVDGCGEGFLGVASVLVEPLLQEPPYAGVDHAAYCFGIDAFDGIFQNIFFAEGDLAFFVFVVSRYFSIYALFAQGATGHDDALLGQGAPASAIDVAFPGGSYPFAGFERDEYFLYGGRDFGVGEVGLLLYVAFERQLLVFVIGKGVDALYVSLSGAGHGQGVDGVVPVVEPLGPIFDALRRSVVDGAHLGEVAGTVSLYVEVVQDRVPPPYPAQEGGYRAAGGIGMVAYLVQHGKGLARDVLALAHLPVEKVLWDFLFRHKQIPVFGLGDLLFFKHLFYARKIVLELVVGQAAHVVVGGAVVFRLVAGTAGAHFVVETVVEVERAGNDVFDLGVVARQKGFQADVFTAVDASVMTLLV